MWDVVLYKFIFIDRLIGVRYVCTDKPINYWL